MEENEDEPEDVRKATPVEEEVKRGEIDELSAKPTQPFDATTRKHHRCEKNIAKKRAVKSEGECCQAKLAKAAKAPKTATVFVYEKECTLPKTKVIPRHCLSKDEWIDILATPSRKCPSPCLRKAVTRKIRPVSPRMAELAQPPKQRLLNTLQDRGGTLPIELLDNLIQTLEGETCLTPEQAEQMFRDKDNRSKKKCRKKKNHPCKSNKSGKQIELGVASNISSLDKEAVHCQYSMAESFVKSILEWKCPIPREEFKDIADVILKRLGYILEYSPVNGEDRKSQQMRFLADIIASWIAGVLFDVAEARKSELEEECERRRKEKEEETDEDSDDEEDSDDDDDDDDKMPGGRGGPSRKGKDDKRRKGGKDVKEDDDDKKPGKPGKKEESKLELAGEGVTPVPSAPEESTLMPEMSDKERESKEEDYYDARTESVTPPDGDEKKTSVKKPEDMKSEEKVILDHKDEEPKEDTIIDKIPEVSTTQQYPTPEVPLAKDEMETSIVKESGDEEQSKKALESKRSRDLVKGDIGIGKEDDDLVTKKSADASQGPERNEAISDEKKPGGTFVDNSEPLAVAKEITEDELLGMSEVAPIATVAKTNEVGDSDKIIAELPTDNRAGGDKEIAAKAIKIPEVSMISESKITEDTPITTIPIDSGEPGTKAQKDLTITSPIQESSIPVVEEQEFQKEKEVKTSVDPSGEEIKILEKELREDDELKMKTVEISQDSSTIPTAETVEGEETKLEEDDELKKVIEPIKDLSSVATMDELGVKKIDSMMDDDRKIVEPSEDPSSLITIEALKDKRRESEKKKSSKKLLRSTALVGKGYETDPPFLTFDKIFHTIYNAIEATNENPGVDSITNRLHRAVYEKCSYVVQEENPGPMSELTKDVLDVMSGKIALWLRNVLTDSQLSFMNKFPATVESMEVREWSKWISYVSDTANTWSAWIQQTIRQAEDMRSNVITRGDWQDWTKAVETDAIRWRRFYLESVHQAHENLTMIRDRHIVKTGTKRLGEQKEEYEKEMKITDLEVER